MTNNVVLTKDKFDDFDFQMNIFKWFMDYLYIIEIMIEKPMRDGRFMFPCDFTLVLNPGVIPDVLTDDIEIKQGDKYTKDEIVELNKRVVRLVNSIMNWL